MRKMKDSGIEWINQVPFDWEVKKLKYCFTFGKGLSITKDNLEESGIPVISYGQIHSKLNTGTSVNDSLIRYVNESYLRTDKSALVKKNDFIFADTSEDLEGCGNCIYNDFNGNLFAGYHTIIFRSQQSNAKYFAYLFLTDCWRSQIRKVASGVKLYSITQKILKETSIIIPPLPEQKKIADFLDAKCADIDQIRADIDKQIEILTDYKKSIITEAVTKGFDPKAKMKDSGIEWVGKIPEHWECKPIGIFFNEINKKNVNGFITNPLKFTYGTIVPKQNFDADSDEYVAKTILNYNVVDFGTIMINGLNLNYDLISQRVGLVKDKGIITSAYLAIKAKDFSKVNPFYAMYAFKFYDFCMAFHNMGEGVRKTLGFDELRHVYFMLPSIKEQEQIVSYLDEKCSEIDATIAEKQKQLETLEEYKKSLIFEYVTGKKEVV